MFSKDSFYLVCCSFNISKDSYIPDFGGFFQYILRIFLVLSNFTYSVMFQSYFYVVEFRTCLYSLYLCRVMVEFGIKVSVGVDWFPAGRPKTCVIFFCTDAVAALYEGSLRQLLLQAKMHQGFILRPQSHFFFHILS